MTLAASAAIMDAGNAGSLFVSPVTWWEIGLLTQPERKQSLDLAPDTASFLRAVLVAPGVVIVDLTPDILFQSSHLPRPIHTDPGDRMLIATARALDCPILTDDRKILAYANAGHVKAIRC
jgi:PIN domain nuclease of toxin-antitoxin system